MVDKSLSDVYDSGRTRLSEVDNLRERALAAIITVSIIASLALAGSPAAAVQTSLTGPSGNVDVNNNDDVTLEYDITIESNERIQVDGYEFELTEDSNSDTTTIEADGPSPSTSDISFDGNELGLSSGDIQSVNADFSGVNQYGYGELTGYNNAGYDAYAGYGYGYGYSAGGDNTITVTLIVDGDAFNLGGHTADAQVITDGDDSSTDFTSSTTFTVVDSSSSDDDDDDEEEDEETEDEEEQEDDDDGGTGGQPGGGQPGGGQPGSGETGDEDTGEEETDGETGDQEDSETSTPTVEEVRQVLDQTEPDTETTSEIADADPDTPGVNVRPEGTESVEEVTFDDEGVSGNLDIREWQDPPEEVSQSVSGAVQSNEEVAEEVAEEAETDVEGDSVTAQVVTVADIDPTSEEAASSSATVTMTADAAQLEDPQDAVIVHETEDSWEALETTVEERGEDEIVLSADTDGFSLFAVTEVEQAESGSTDDGTDETDDGGAPTALIVVGLLAVIAVAGAALYARNNGDL